MKFRDLFRAKASHNGVEQLNTRELDTFADNVIYELKTLISNAVAEALEEKESRYLRSILEDSFFTKWCRTNTAHRAVPRCGPLPN